MKKVILSVLLLLALVITLVSCGETEGNNSSEKQTTKTEETTKSADIGSPEQVAVEFTATVDAVELTACASSQATTLYEASESSIPEASKESIKLLYENILCAMSSVEGTTEQVKATLNTLYNSLNEAIYFAKNLKDAKVLVEKQLTALYDAAKAIGDADYTAVVKSAYDTAKANLEQMVSREALEAELMTCVTSLRAAIETAAREMIAAKLAELKTVLKAKVEAYLLALTEATDDSTILSAISQFKTTALAQIDSASDMKTAAGTAKSKLESAKQFATEKAAEIIAKVKAAALDKLDTVVESLLAYLPESASTIKTQIETFYNTEKGKIDAIKTIDDAKGFVATVTKDCTDFAAEITPDILAFIKESALAGLDAIVNPALELITDTTLKGQLTTYYNNEKALIEAIESVDGAKAAAAQIVADTQTKATEILASQLVLLKTAALDALDDLVLPALEQITDTDLNAELSTFYAAEKEKINGINSIDTASATLKEVADDSAEEVATILAAQLAKLKEAAIAQIDELVDAALEKIPDEDLQKELADFYDEEVAIINAVTTIEGVAPALTTVKEDTEEEIVTILASQLTKLKTKAIADLDAIVNPALEKLTDQTLKTELTTYYNTEKGKINAINSIDSAQTTIATVLQETQQEALRLLAKKIEALRNTVKGYAQVLQAAYQISPYSYLPATMNPAYTANLLATAPAYDFTTSTNISDIQYGGFGEQWHMIVEEITNTGYFYKVFNSASSVFSTVLAHLSSEYTAEIDKTFENEGFSASISYKDGVLTVAVVYTTSIENAYFGSVTPSINMTYDSATGASVFAITLTDTNKVKLIVTEDKYEFGMKIGVNQLTRSSYVVIEKDGTDVEGHVNQYTTVAGKEIESSADFYADANYVSVVGNKASGMVAFTGYINELYNVSTGKLLGYKVQETLSAVTYNTLWFNLNDISGINSVKVTDKTNANKSGKSTCDVYLNGSATLLSPTYNKAPIIGTKTSRKYDIELRKMYYYGLDAESKLVEYAVEIPMMFIQDGDNFTSYSADILADNAIVSAVTMNATVLAQIRNDYDTLIPAFITNKENNTSADVTAFLN